MIQLPTKEQAAAMTDVERLWAHTSITRQILANRAQLDEAQRELDETLIADFSTASAPTTNEAKS